MNIIDINLVSLKSLCKTYNVDRMYVFGSALTPDFNENSDLDFLVRFKKIDLAQYFDNYFSFKDNLQSLFNHKVDLLEEQSLQNPILIKSINHSKKLVYG